MRAAFKLIALAALALTAGCKRGGDTPEATATEVPKAVAAQADAAATAVESKYGTPVKDRVATLGLLNKRNNLEQDLVMKPGEAKRVGNVVVKLASCERTLPWETNPETGAFVQVFVEERAAADKPLEWRKVFSGWLFKNSPSLNVVEHPVYDVWVKDCAMKFPGEEEDLSAATAKAAKASGKDKAKDGAKPGGKPKPAPSPDAAPDAAAPAEEPPPA